MEKPIQSDSEEHSLTLPDKSRVSTILNGMGNGMMVGSIPFIVAESMSHITGRPVTKTMSIASLTATFLGGIFGGIYGKLEADQVDNYRSTLSSEIKNIHRRIDRAKSHGAWSEHVKTEEQNPDTIAR